MRARLAQMKQTRRGILSLLVMLAMLAGGSAYAIAAATGTPSPSPKSSKPAASKPAGADNDENGVHGGPKARIHAGCTAATGLTGNWTHGDYVSAVAKANSGDSEKIKAAAHSDCGKVDHGAGHGKPATAGKPK